MCMPDTPPLLLVPLFRPVGRMRWENWPALSMISFFLPDYLYTGHWHVLKDSCSSIINGAIQGLEWWWRSGERRSEEVLKQILAPKKYHYNHGCGKDLAKVFLYLKCKGHLHLEQKSEFSFIVNMPHWIVVTISKISRVRQLASCQWKGVRLWALNTGEDKAAVWPKLAVS